MENNELLDLLKDFITESKAADITNAKEHKEINVCLMALKLKIGNVESFCKTSDDIRNVCFKKQEDIEDRLREVELLKPLADLPKKFEELTINVYRIMGATSVITALIMLIAGILLKNSIISAP